MTRPHWLLFAALAVMSCVLGNAQDAPRSTAPSATAPSDIKDLKGKVIAITLFSDGEDLALISEVSLRRIGEKSFLVGKGVDDGETPDWRNGAMVYIPVDDIQQLVAFADLKAYQKNLNSRLDRAEGKAASATRRSGRTIAQRRPQGTTAPGTNSER